MIKDNSESRINITKIVHELINSSLSIDECVKQWWKTPHPYGGFCLTELGAKAFDAAEIEYSLHPFFEGDNICNNTLQLSSGYLVRLSVLMPCPYYLIGDRRKSNIIRVYDDRISTLIYLYGDIDKYLYSLENE